MSKLHMFHKKAPGNSRGFSAGSGSDDKRKYYIFASVELITGSKRFNINEGLSPR